MSTVDKAKLRELAAKATAGPWGTDGLEVTADTRELVCCGRGGYECCGDPDVYGSADDVIATASHEDCAAFIAAANPATVLALLDEIEALRKDAERYRWLRLGGNEDGELDRWEDVGYVCGVSVCTDYGLQQTLDSESLDEAIDAAMQREKGRG